MTRTYLKAMTPEEREARILARAERKARRRESEEHRNKVLVSIFYDEGGPGTETWQEALRLLRPVPDDVRGRWLKAAAEDVAVDNDWRAYKDAGCLWTKKVGTASQESRQRIREIKRRIRMEGAVVESPILWPRGGAPEA